MVSRSVYLVRGVLHPSDRSDAPAPGRDRARGERHAQGVQRQLRIEMTAQLPANAAATERVQHDGEVDEFRAPGARR